MSQKEEILEMLKDGASYDQIEIQTGATRGYIRQTASDFRQRDKANDVSTESVKSEGTPENKDVNENKTIQKGEVLEFEDKSEKTWDDLKVKSGMEYHKEWVDAKKYECNCGCTLNSKGDYCPHCGTSLDWSGING